MPQDCDLLIHAQRIVCPASGLDSAGAVALRGDRIAAAGRNIAASTRRELHYPDAVLLPGLIDLHAHPARSGSQFGIDPDQHLLARGTTTALSQGDAGAANCDHFLRDTIACSRTRVVLAINLASVGEQGPGGCLEQIETADVAACVAAVERHRPHVWGIAVNVSHLACGQTDPREVLKRGLAAAELTSLPILFGLRRPEDWPLADQLKRLRPGDVVTYCFRSEPHGIVRGGRVPHEIRDARERGILFDVGHGRRSFSFDVAAAALLDGFPPDTISTDLQLGHVGQHPVHDLPLVMSKLRACGMTERDVFAAVTSRPARVLRRDDDIGSLAVDSAADLTLLSWKDGPFLLVDVDGQTRTGGRWEAIATIRSGTLVEPPAVASAKPDP
jgi:dihydroorotase